MLGDGGGALGAAHLTYVPGGPAGLATGHFDEDGLLDIVVVDPAANVVRAYLGDGLGGFFSAGALENKVGASPSAVAVSAGRQGARVRRGHVTLTIGQAFVGGASTAPAFDGALWEVSLWGRGLQATDVAALYAGGAGCSVTEDRR